MSYITPLFTHASGQPSEPAHFFEQMNLPVPHAGESYRRPVNPGDRHLVFLNDFGLVIRITANDLVMNQSHPHFLKPLFTRQGEKYRIDIDPGIDCTATRAETKKIYAYLGRTYGIQVDDERPDNVGFIPDGTRRYPVLIDLDPRYTRICPDSAAVERLSASARLAATLLKWRKPAAAFDPDHQEKFYKPLLDLAADMWPAHRNNADPAKIAQFFSACAAFKQRQNLLSIWTDEANNYNYTTWVARAYAMRLEKHAGPAQTPINAP